MGPFAKRTHALQNLRLATYFWLVLGPLSTGIEAFYYLDEQYRIAVRQAQQDAEGIAATAQAATAEVFGHTVGILDGLAGVYLGERVQGTPEPTYLTHLMAEERDQLPAIEALVLATPDGTPVAAVGADVARLVDQIPTSTTPGTRYVGKPYSIADGQVVQPIGIRLNEDGKIIAIVMAAVKTASISALYTTFPIGAHGAIALETGVGDRVTSYGVGRTSAAGGIPAAAPIEQEIGARTLFDVPSLGLLKEVNVSTHVDSLPLVIVVHIDGADFLEIWIAKCGKVLVVALVISLLLIAAWLTFRRRVGEAAENEAALRKAKADADDANEAKSRFLAHMSHEFRTPLNAIMGFSDIIKSKVMGGEVAPVYTTYADHIHRSGAHLLSIVNDILDMAKIESGSETLQRHAVDIANVTRSAVSFVEGVATQFGVGLATDITPGLPALNGDERFVRQVLINLLTNAIKFSKSDGTVTIRACTAHDSSLEIVVIDQGPGIDPAIVRRIGEPFLQGDPALSRLGRGTGLGLSICKHYMSLLGGELLITSTPGHGTRAAMHFPAEMLLRRNEAA